MLQEIQWGKNWQNTFLMTATVTAVIHEITQNEDLNTQKQNKFK